MPAGTERFYIIVDERPRSSEGQLVLTDGSAVICLMEDKAAALASIANDKRLGFRRHSELSRADQQKVLRAA